MNEMTQIYCITAYMVTMPIITYVVLARSPSIRSNLFVDKENIILYSLVSVVAPILIAVALIDWALSKLWKD